MECVVCGVSITQSAQVTPYGIVCPLHGADFHRAGLDRMRSLVAVPIERPQPAVMFPGDVPAEREPAVVVEPGEPDSPTAGLVGALAR